MNINSKKKLAFSLIELSIVILIISIIISGSLSVSKTSIRNAKIKITKERLVEINKGLANYLITNRKLPCPASIILTNTHPSYGKVDGTDGSCSDGPAGGVYTSSSSSNLVYGMIPINDIDLANEMAEDGFGSKFSYVIDKRFTAAFNSNSPSADTFEGATSTTGMIDIRELSASGTSVVNNAVFAVISHGPNRFGAYASSSTSQNPSSTVSDEVENYLPATQSAFNEVFVTNSTDQSYDDKMIFRTRLQIARDANFEEMLCPDVKSNDYDADAAGTNNECDASPSLIEWDPDQYYFAGEYAKSDNSCLDVQGSGSDECVSDHPDLSNKSIVKCGKYGQWGRVLYRCRNN